MVSGLHPEVKGSAAQDQPHQHNSHGDVESGEDNTVGLGEGDQEYAYTHHDPGLVGVPEGADRSDHHILFAVATKRQQHADAQIEAVENDIQKQRQPHG